MPVTRKTRACCCYKRIRPELQRIFRRPRFLAATSGKRVCCVNRRPSFECAPTRQAPPLPRPETSLLDPCVRVLREIGGAQQWLAANRGPLTENLPFRIVKSTVDCIFDCCVCYTEIYVEAERAHR